MKPASIRQKGKRLERQFAALLRRKGLDVNARRMPLSGAFSHLPTDIYTSLRYSFEVKNQERVNLWEWWDQARNQAAIGKPPVLVISGNYRPMLAIVEVDTLLNLLLIEQQAIKT